MKKYYAIVCPILLSSVLFITSCGNNDKTSELESKIAALESQVSELKDPPVTTTGVPVLVDEETGTDYEAIVKDIMMTVYGYDIDDVENSVKKDAYYEIDYNMWQQWNTKPTGKVSGFKLNYSYSSVEPPVIEDCYIIFAKFENKDDYDIRINLFKQDLKDNPQIVAESVIIESYPFAVTVTSYKKYSEVQTIIEKYL